MGEFIDSWIESSRFSTASGNNTLPYVVLQVTLKEKFLGTGSGNLTDLEEVINTQVAKGYRLHTMSTSNGGSKGLGGGDRIQATLVFERLDFAFGGNPNNNQQISKPKPEDKPETTIVEPPTPPTPPIHINPESSTALIDFQNAIRNETSIIAVRKIWRESGLGATNAELNSKIEVAAEIERLYGRGSSAKTIHEICEMIDNGQ